MVYLILMECAKMKECVVLSALMAFTLVGLTLLTQTNNEKSVEFGDSP